MGLITKPKVPTYAEEDQPMPCQEPVIASEHFCKEAVDELEKEQAFRRVLDATLSPGVDEHRQLEKRRENKARFWLTKMMAPGEKIDWEQVIARMRKHDPRSAKFLAKLVIQAREYDED